MNGFRLGVLLHFFQPYWQFKEVLERITAQCYRPIFRFVRERGKGFAFTMNMNYSLLNLLEKQGYDDVLDDIKFCVQNNLIELVGTAAFHPIIPLIPAKEAGKQIAEDIHKKKIMGIAANSKGFFFPEMAFNMQSLNFLRQKFGFNWTVVQDVAVLPWKIPFDHIISYRGFSVFLRSSHWSEYIWNNHINFYEFAEKLNYELPAWFKGGSGYLVIAMDAETFGHHVPGLSESFLFPLTENWGNGIILPFEKLVDYFPRRESEELSNCSWSTNYSDLYCNDPFPLWKSKYNKNQLILWNLVEMALKYADCPEAIHECLKMVNSCHWWWISRDHWNPRFMLIGAKKAFDVIEKCGTKKEKIEARCYLDILESLCY